MTTLIQYAERGRNAWWLYPLATAGSLIAAMLIGIVLGVVLALAHVLPPDLTAQMTHPTRPVVFFVANGVSFACILAGFAGVIRLAHAKRFGDLVGDWRWGAVAAGAALWLAVQMVSALADYGLAPHSFSLTASPATWSLLLAAAPALAVQTFTEEFVFRGYVTQAMLLATRRPIVAAVLSGLLFGAVHIPNGAPQAVNAVLFGIATAWLAIRTGGIGFTWGLHLANNLFGAVVVVSASDVFHGSPGLFTQNAPQMMWLDVAVQGVLIGAIAVLVGRRFPPAAAQPATPEVFS